MNIESTELFTERRNNMLLIDHTLFSVLKKTIREKNPPAIVADAVQELNMPSSITERRL
ncbi:MAG: hypothetical protein R3B95_07900 [Nitrospirales bacterium]|nr:hypothetical protein [Nitrospirales bacterium]